MLGIIKQVKKISAIIFLSIVVVLIISGPLTAVAADSTPNSTPDCPAFSTSGEYCLLTGKMEGFFPYGVVKIRAEGLDSYLNTLYKVGVAAATGLALIYITIGGVKYASTDAVTGKDEGRGMISNALLGLMIVLGSYIILNAINPDLLKNDLVLDDVKAWVPLSADTNGLVIANDGVVKYHTETVANDGTGSAYTNANIGQVVYVDGQGKTVVGGGDGVAIDYDSSPGVYKVVEDPNGKYTINGKKYSSVGYEDLSNAGTNGNWWGVQTSNGKSSGDPIINTDGTLKGQLSWGTGKVDGNTTAFVAMNASQIASAKQTNPSFGLGSTVILTNPSTGKSIQAVYADNHESTRSGGLTEMSPAAATALGIGYGKNSNGKNYASGNVIMSVK